MLLTIFGSHRPFPTTANIGSRWKIVGTVQYSTVGRQGGNCPLGALCSGGLFDSVWDKLSASEEGIEPIAIYIDLFKCVEIQGLLVSFYVMLIVNPNYSTFKTLKSTT